MKKILLIVSLSIGSSFACAESNFAVGVGQPYGGVLGLGARYAQGISEDFRATVGLGLLAYSSKSGSALGYNLGFEYIFDGGNHTLGLSYGTVKGSDLLGDQKSYDGPSLNYSYYFSGANKASWVLGAGVCEGKRDVPNDYYSDSTSGGFIHFGYQF